MDQHFFDTNKVTVTAGEALSLGSCEWAVTVTYTETYGSLSDFALGQKLRSSLLY